MKLIKVKQGDAAKGNVNKKDDRQSELHNIIKTNIAEVIRVAKNISAAVEQKGLAVDLNWLSKEVTSLGNATDKVKYGSNEWRKLK